MQLRTLAVLLLVATGACASDPETASVSEDVLPNPRDHRNVSTHGDVWEPATTGVIARRQVTLLPLSSYVFQTQTQSGDPVLHLFNSQGVQVAYDDDSAGAGNARMTFQTSIIGGTYTLVVRATTSDTGGTTDLYQNGARIAAGVPFGGAVRRYENLRGGETLTTVPLPRGPTAGGVMLFLDAVGGNAQALRYAGANSSAVVTVGSAGVHYVSIGEIYDIGGILPMDGPVRLVRNDAWREGFRYDLDGDGLGDELEASLGTCSAITATVPFDCRTITDPRDTDGDGISDYLELYGKVDVAPYQLLPRWGANPMHKDIFIEDDFMQRAPGEVDQPMQPAYARSMVDLYGEPSLDPTSFDGILHAALVGNPDGRPGVSLHIDTGVDGNQLADATKFGNWGGHNLVGYVVVNGQIQGRSQDDAYANGEMNAVRKGIFHYALTFPGKAGQNGVDIATAYGHDDDATPAHEFGHSLGLQHYGSLPPTTPELNCKPNYPSVMSYAPPAPLAFSDGYGRPPYDDVTLVEKGAVDVSTARGVAYLTRLSHDFGYRVNSVTGDVDWNRDGVFSDGTVEAYADNQQNGQCEATSSSRVANLGHTFVSPAIARAGGLLMVFYVDGGVIHAEQGTASQLDCGAPPWQACPTALSRFTLPGGWNQSIAAVSARPDGGANVQIVFRTTSGVLYAATYIASVRLTTLPVALPTAAPVATELGLTGPGSHLWLSYADASGNVMLRRFTSGAWGPELAAAAADSPIVAGNSPNVYETPTGALYGVFPTAGPTQTRIEQLDPTTGAVVATLLPANGLTGPAPAGGRPGLVWRKQRGLTTPDGGRLILYYAHDEPGLGRPLRERWQVSFSRGFPPGLIWGFDFDAYHSNSFYSAYGFDILYDPAIDSNVRMIASYRAADPSKDTDAILELRPRADGIIDAEQHDRDDWEPIGVGLCRVLAAQQPASSRMVCPDWQWGPTQNMP